MLVSDNSEKENDMPDNDTEEEDDEEGEVEAEADDDAENGVENTEEIDRDALFETNSVRSNDFHHDDATSDSFCSELYSSYTSSSFSPSLSDGMTTPNSIANEGDLGVLGGPALGNGADSFGPGSGDSTTTLRTGESGGRSSERRNRTDNNNKIIKNNNHTNSHSKNNDGTYRCQFCDKTFPRLGYLKKHEQSHTEHMPFKCEYCARLFKHKRSRDRHTKLHTGDRRYRCPHCEAAFSRSDHLKIHMKTHDNQKPFQCTICNRGYNTAAALTSHMQNHKKQIALTGSPNLTYSPRSTSSLSSSASNPKRKFSPYEQNLMMINSTKLLKSGDLACIYCTRTDFATIEQLGVHVQAMHSNLLLNENNFHRHTPPDPMLTYPPIPCEFCTMKFPTVPMMYSHLKTTHLDKISSPNSYLEQFNKNLMNTYSAFYSSTMLEDNKRQTTPSDDVDGIKSERPTNAEKASRDENGNEESAPQATLVNEKDIKQEKKDENDNSRDAAEEQIAPTDLSQPRMKRMKMEHDSSSPSTSSSNRLGIEKESSPINNSMSSGGGGGVVGPPTTSGSGGGGGSSSVGATPPGAYLCNQCNAALPDFESFRTHLKAHLEQGSTASSFMCQQCGVALADQQEYEKHVTGHYLVTGSEYLCDSTCSKSFGKAEELHKHLYDAHTQVLYKCQLCSDTFDSKVTIQVHFAVAHSNEVKLFRCSACAEILRTEREFRHHIRTRHITLGAVQCVFCQVVCSSELEMQFHLSAHARKFKCPACSESFHVEFLLDRHMQTHHSQKEISNATASGVGSNANQGPNLEYLHLQGQMAAAAASWQNLYAANKFYNPLHVDTLSSMKHSNFLHGFYDSLSKSHAQRYLDQSKKAFISPNSSPQTKALLNLYNQQRSAALNGMCSTDNLLTSGVGASISANATPNNPTPNSSSAKPSQMYSPTTLLHRYGLPAASGSSSSTANSASRDSLTAAEKLAAAAAAAAAVVNTKVSANSHNNSNTGNTNHNNNNSQNASNNFYSCGICERNDFTTESEVQTHRKIVHNLKTGVSLRCAYCSGDFRSRNELENHMKIAHNTGGKHKCLICDEIFPSPAVLAEHKLTHCKVGASGRCSHCPTILPDVHSFKSHLTQHQSPTAGNSSSNANSSNSTASEQQERFPIQCICCRQTLNSEFEISLHAKFHTKSTETNEKTCALCLEPLAPGQDTKICDHCLKRHNFPSKLLSINNFIKASTNTSHPSSLKKSEDANTQSHQHHSEGYAQQIQQNQSPPMGNTYSSKCNLCKKTLPDGHKLQEHLIDHTFAGCEDRGYVCYLCSSVFTSSAGLQSHIAEHGPQSKPYDCSHCKAAFFFRAELEHHLIDHEQGNVSGGFFNSQLDEPPMEIKAEIIDAPSTKEMTSTEQDPSQPSTKESPEERLLASPEVPAGDSEDSSDSTEDDEYIEVEHHVDEHDRNKQNSVDKSKDYSSNECSE
ncbi:zinc finger protein 423 homolog isoform X2 [Uranotaenia lowii]|nr:zinc finger protein 423 homolog isoform X2 [Uranotaenia lowii]XP_055593055.1 zinc finger protein 423 homolog isoform X2 [Uranotaenia lowii]